MQVEQLGLSQKDVFSLLIVQELEHGPAHGADLYRAAQETLPGRNPSRTNFYKTLKLLAEQGLISGTDIGKKTVYGLTAAGRELKDNFTRLHYEKLAAVYEVVHALYADVTNQPIGTPLALAKEHRLFFSKLVSVRDVIKYVILKELLKGNHGTARRQLVMGELHRAVADRFGWQFSESYLYEIVGLMEQEEGFIRGRWEDDYKRTKRYYSLTDRGAEPQIFRQIEEATATRVRDVRDLLLVVLQLMEQPVAHTVRNTETV